MNLKQFEYSVRFAELGCLSRAALAGIRGDVAREFSSAQTSRDLVRAGYRHTVIARATLAASGHPGAFGLRSLPPEGAQSVPFGRPGG